MILVIGALAYVIRMDLDDASIGCSSIQRSATPEARIPDDLQHAQAILLAQTSRKLSIERQ